MTKTFKKSVSILLAVIMILSVFTIVPMSAGASTWTFKLNSNFFVPAWSQVDIQSSTDFTFDLAAGEYQFQVIAYEDENLRAYRGNEQAGQFTDTYSQTLYDNGGNAKFKATGGRYVLNYDGGSGLLTINPVQYNIVYLGLPADLILSVRIAAKRAERYPTKYRTLIPHGNTICGIKQIKQTVTLFNDDG